MSAGRDEVTVHLDSPDLGRPRRIGVLRQARTGTLLDVAFAYDAAWVADAPALQLDPELQPHEGDQRPTRGVLHGIFDDTAPDRWGRLLLTRREAHAARRERRRPRPLDDWDFLTGVSDELRMGALRLERGGGFVTEGGVPPLARLRELQYYAERAERGEEISGADAETEVALLLAPGSSLGGGRPKGNIRGDDGAPWIAKFPSRDDLRDMGAWEFVLNRLAAAAGIPVPESRLLEVRGAYRTFCARRFDRTGAGRRMFASAMTLTRKRNGDAAGYLDIVEAIEDYGDPRGIVDDLEQLFRRAAFAVLVGHRDDHLRNHGFLGGPRGWRLSPAFDLNPLPDKAEHTLDFDGEVRMPELDVVLRTAEYYRLSDARAVAIVAEVRAAIADWRAMARDLGIPKAEIDPMSAAIQA